MITLRKLVLYCKMVFKMLIIGANSVKEDGIDNLVSLKTARGQSCVPLLMKGTFFLPFEIYRVLLKENNSIHHFYCQIKVMFPWELVAVCLDKGERCRLCYRWYRVGAGYKLLLQWAHQVSSAAREKRHHSPQALRQCCTCSQILLTLTVAWIADSLKCSALWAQITIAAELLWMEEKQNIIFKSAGKQTWT